MANPWLENPKIWRIDGEYRESWQPHPMSKVALKQPNTWVRIFGKPMSPGHRRMAVVMALGKTVTEARKKAALAAKQIRVLKK